MKCVAGFDERLQALDFAFRQRIGIGGAKSGDLGRFFALAKHGHGLVPRSPDGLALGLGC